MLYLESLNKSLHQILKNKNTFFLGEDILDPYGGAFKVSKGLSSKFPDRVISTPISEAGMIGCAVGMAMRGQIPIVEIMFGDFISLAADQIINHASKYNWMYNHKVNVPLVIRTPVGGKRGYGPTHSQSLESIFMPVSGIEIVAPSICHNPGVMLEGIIKTIDKPTIFVEYKMDYSQKLCEDKIRGLTIKRDQNKGFNENLTLSLYPDEKPDICLITYGGSTSIAAEAAEKIFMEYEILVDVLVLSSIRPIDIDWIVNKVKDSGKILLIEEGNKVGGWCGEVSSLIQENIFDYLKAPIRRIGGMDMPIPSSGPMEIKILPSIEKIINQIKILAES